MISSAIFMELELGDNFRGQYFTPYSVQCLMARMLMPASGDTIRREGIATVSDPAWCRRDADRLCRVPA
jgi:hypothetical protein